MKLEIFAKNYEVELSGNEYTLVKNFYSQIRSPLVHGANMSELREKDIMEEKEMEFLHIVQRLLLAKSKFVADKLQKSQGENE